MTRVLRLTKSPETTAPLERAFANHVRDVNVDLDLLDGAIGAIPANPMTTPQDLIVGGVAGAPTRLGVGAAGQVLTVVGGVLTWAAPAVPATTNILVNPGLEVWQRGTGPFTAAGVTAADRWVLSQGTGSTMSVSRDAANQDTGSQYCAAIGYTQSGANVSRFLQVMEAWASLRGRTVTFTARVRTATASAARIGVWDSVSGFRYSAYHTGDGTYQTLAVTAPIAAAATGVQVSLHLDATATVYLDSAVLVPESTAPAYAPLHPADDLARCLRYYQEIGGLSTFEVVGAAGVALSGTTADFRLAFVAPMAIAPTITISAAGDWTISNNTAGQTALATLPFSQITTRSARALPTVAAGLTAGQAALLIANNTLTARIKLEANPP